MDEAYLTIFRARFRALVDEVGGFEALAEESGYSIQYLKWTAGVWGKKPWPGSRCLIARMQALGLDIELPPQKRLVEPCRCGEVHTRECRYGRSREPDFLRQIQRIAVPWLEERDGV